MLLNALRLFIYPTAHTLYGDEYGLKDSGIDSVKQRGSMPDVVAGFSENKALMLGQLQGYVKVILNVFYFFYFSLNLGRNVTQFCYC